MNHEGYSDPTADRAVYRADHLPPRAYRTYKLLLQIARFDGIELEEIKGHDMRDPTIKYIKHWRRDT